MIEVEGDDLDTQANNYISQDRDYNADLQKFFIQIKDKTPKTIRHHLSVARARLRALPWLESQYIPINKVEVR